MKPGKAAPARRAAWEIFGGLHAGKLSVAGKTGEERPLPVLLDEAARQYALEPRDAGLLTELVCGSLRREGRLGHALKDFVPRPKSLPPALFSLLLLATYELLFLDIPARATVHQYVGLARGRFGDRLGGLANGVLRGVDRNRESLLAADAAFCSLPPEGRSVEDIARAGAWPLWLAKLLVGQYGVEAVWRWALSSAVVPPASWRLNLSRASHADTAAKLKEFGLLALAGPDIPVFQGVAGDAVFYVPESLDLAGKGAELRQALVEWEAGGDISRQGAGAAVAARRLAADMAAYASKPLWDACCGRGGKSCALLERGVNVSLCSDPSEARLRQAPADMARLGLPVPEICRGSVEEVGKDRSFPLILLDVPCSGTGTLARAPELRLRLTPERSQELMVLQAAILEQAWASLEPGGLLMYMTCSLDERENSTQLRSFIDEHSDAALVGEELFLPLLPGHDFLFRGLLRKAYS